MKKEEILKTINEYMESEDIALLLDLKDKLIEDIRQEPFKATTSNKKQLKAIEKLLKGGVKTGRDILGSYCKIDDYCYITDSYVAFKLKREYLPFKVAATSEQTNEYVQEFAKKYNLDVVQGLYPNVEQFFEPKHDIVDTYSMSIKEFDVLYKTTPSDESTHKVKVYNIKNDKVNITFDLNKLKQVIDILGITTDFTLEFYGDTRPILIHYNDDMGLVVPIITF